jgi:hypothetical protein
LFDGPDRPKQLRRPADLTFDFLDELADLSCRRIRLLALDLDQRFLMLAIGNPYFEDAVGEQRHANHGNEQRGIFQEQAAASFPRHVGAGCSGALGRRVVGHPATSSARARGVGRPTAVPPKAKIKSRRRMFPPKDHVFCNANL